MPATYEPIATTTLGSDTASVTFSSITGSYTDLVLIVAGRDTNTSASDNYYLRFNSDSGSNYSVTRLQGNGSTAASNRGSNLNVGYIGYVPGANASADSFSANVVHINNYSNTTTNKTSIGRSAVANDYAAAFVMLWRSTSAITSILIAPDAGNWKSGSTFTLYGIKAA